MKTAIVTLESVDGSPYSQSRNHNIPREKRETADDHEKRTWRERLHVTDDGHVKIPPMAFKNCIAEVAKYKSVQIPGKGKTTYTKHFEAGVMVSEPLILPDKAEEVEGEWLYLNADGRRGGGKRVWKCYPCIRSWKGDVTFYIFDDTVTKDVFIDHLEDAGRFIGIGRFRPRNNGYYGRFVIKKVKWV
jgi:hypothetical protein